MADNGVIIIGDQTVGYTERVTYVYWDILPDLVSNRSVMIETPFYRILDTRYVAHQHIDYVYCTRWTHIEYEPTPITERTIFVHYAKCFTSDRITYYYPDTRERLVFAEGLLTNTPLLMKYPKYYNWNYVPQIINPEFILWSYYELVTNDITLKIMSSGGTTIFLNSGVSPDSFTTTKIADDQYKISVIVDHTFDTDETVTCYVTAYDIKNNYLKPGMW